MKIFRKFSYAIMMIIACYSAFAADGDTTVVRTIEFTNERAGWFDFPELNSKSYRKVVMNFKIKCPPGKQCGEWDYVSNVFVDHYYAPSYRINGTSPATYSFMDDTSWNFKPEKINDVWVLTKTAKSPQKLYFYDINSAEPTKATDSLNVWEPYYTYTMNGNGELTDSSLVAPDQTLTLQKKRVYFKDNITIYERYEVMRYITPYGNGLQLGDGWLYQIDVTDFVSLLAGKVYLYSPCGGWGNQLSQTDQESLELTFAFIEGTPTRDIVRFEKFIVKERAYYDGKFEEMFPAKNITFAPNEKGARLKVIQTGHGFAGNDDNCAEFCKKEANVAIDGTKRYSRYIWRECGDMALYPQGGTWLNDRTNWCPGMDVEYHDYELTPFISSGGTHSIDYSMEYYNNPITPGSNHEPIWVITSYLITYGDPKFNNDAEILDIITPTKKQSHLRKNPACFNYSTLVKNNGKNPITKIEFRFGYVGDDNVNTYVWEGNLGFLDTTTVIFDNFFRNDDFKTTREYYVEIVKVNDAQDEYASNNIGKSIVDPTPIFPNDLTFNITTNRYSSQQGFSFKLLDHEWNTIKQRTSFTDFKLQEENVVLEEGCYEFIFSNNMGFGLSYFAVAEQLGYGSFNITSKGVKVMDYNPNFGNSIYQQFKVGPVPSVKISSDTLNFGTVDIKDAEKRMEVEISPNTNTDLIIKSMNLILGTKWGFRIIESNPELTSTKPVVLRPGEKMTISIGFDPTREGVNATNLILETNDFYNTEKKVRLTGNAEGEVSVDEQKFEAPELDLKYNSSSNMLKIGFLTHSNISSTKIEIFSSIGSFVANVYNGSSFNGSSEIEFDCSALSSGTYHVVLTNGETRTSKSLVIVK